MNKGSYSSIKSKFIMLLTFISMFFITIVSTKAAGGTLGGKTIAYEINSIALEGDYIDVKGFLYYYGENHVNNGQSYYVKVHSGNNYIGTYKDLNDVYLDHTDFNWYDDGARPNYTYRDVGFHFRIPAKDLVNSGYSTFKLEVHINKSGRGDKGKDVAYVSPNRVYDNENYKMTFEGNSQTSGFYINANELRVRTGPSTSYKVLNINNQNRFWLHGDTYSYSNGTITDSSFNSSVRTTWFKCRLREGGYESEPNYNKKLYRVHPSSTGAYYGWVSSNFTEYGSEDFVIRIAKKRPKIKIRYSMNGGYLDSQHGAGISNSGNYITLNGSYDVQTLADGQRDKYGLCDYNNKNYINIARTGYHIEPGKEWKVGSKVFNQNTELGYDDLYPYANSSSIVAAYANWIPNKYKVDLNSNLDGVHIDKLTVATADVYVNGKLVANDVTDFYEDIDYGSKVEIKDIKTNKGYTYKGGVISGTVSTDGLKLEPKFTTNYYNNNIEHWAWGFMNGEGTDANKEGIKIGDTRYVEKFGNTFVLDESNSVRIPKGYSLVNKFSTKSINGNLSYLPFGTKITQTYNNMSFKYDYIPNRYSIRYNLDGGTVEGNPESYTVLYGVKFKTPSKQGYRFLGWQNIYG